MPREVVLKEGSLNASGKRFAVIASRWHHAIVDQLIEGALETLKREGTAEKDISLIRVPGSFEIPLAALTAARSGHYDAVIALGVLIRGDTDHYQLIAEELSAGLARVMFDTGVPVAFGVLTVHKVEHAEARAGGEHGNKGQEAALAAIEMANLLPLIHG